MLSSNGKSLKVKSEENILKFFNNFSSKINSNSNYRNLYFIIDGQLGIREDSDLKLKTYILALKHQLPKEIYTLVISNFYELYNLKEEKTINSKSVKLLYEIENNLVLSKYISEIKQNNLIIEIKSNLLDLFPDYQFVIWELLDKRLLIEMRARGAEKFLENLIIVNDSIKSFKNNDQDEFINYMLDEKKSPFLFCIKLQNKKIIAEIFSNLDQNAKDFLLSLDRLFNDLPRTLIFNQILKILNTLEDFNKNDLFSFIKVHDEESDKDLSDVEVLKLFTLSLNDYFFEYINIHFEKNGIKIMESIKSGLMRLYSLETLKVESKLKLDELGLNRKGISNYSRLYEKKFYSEVLKNFWELYKIIKDNKISNKDLEHAKAVEHSNSVYFLNTLVQNLKNNLYLHDLNEKFNILYSMKNFNHELIDYYKKFIEFSGFWIKEFIQNSFNKLQQNPSSSLINKGFLEEIFDKNGIIEPTLKKVMEYLQICEGQETTKPEININVAISEMLQNYLSEIYALPNFEVDIRSRSKFILLGDQMFVNFIPLIPTENDPYYDIWKLIYYDVIDNLDEEYSSDEFFIKIKNTVDIVLSKANLITYNKDFMSVNNEIYKYIKTSIMHVIKKFFDVKFISAENLFLFMCNINLYFENPVFYDYLIQTRNFLAYQSLDDKENHILDWSPVEPELNSEILDILEDVNEFVNECLKKKDVFDFFSLLYDLDFFNVIKVKNYLANDLENKIYNIFIGLINKIQLVDNDIKIDEFFSKYEVVYRLREFLIDHKDDMIDQKFDNSIRTILSEIILFRKLDITNLELIDVFKFYMKTDNNKYLKTLINSGYKNKDIVKSLFSPEYLKFFQNSSNEDKCKINVLWQNIDTLNPEFFSYLFSFNLEGIEKFDFDIYLSDSYLSLEVLKEIELNCLSMPAESQTDFL